MINQSEIDFRIRTFKGDLQNLTDQLTVQKHITFGESFILDNNSYFELKCEIAVEYNLHPSQVIVVGSGKLGFSIAPFKRYQPFGDQSDLDVAIVSSDLFLTLWQTAFDYWNGGGFWDRKPDFEHYLFRGWLRPDYVPRSTKASVDWFEFFRNLTQSQKYGPYKVNGAIYQSWWHLERYQQKAVTRCREALESET